MMGFAYSSIFSDQRPFRYWVLLAAIRRIMEDVPYPDVVEVLDAFIGPTGEERPTLDN